MSLRSLRFKGITQLENAQLNAPAMSRGTVGDGVRAIQQALLDLKYPMANSFASYGAPDGVYGGETKSSLIKFQGDNGLVPDGKAGKNTIGKFDEIFEPEHIPPPIPPIKNIEYRVPGKIRLTNQREWWGGASLCWAAALTMMFEWRDRKEHNTRDLLDGIGWRFRVMFESNQMIQKGSWYELARGAGMKCLTPASMTPRDWHTLLKTHGLLWIGAMSELGPGAFGHSFIMYGLTLSPAGDQHVMLINPDGARETYPSFASFNAAFEAAHSAGYPQIRYFAYGR